MERPRIILNCATSQDGCLAGDDGAPVQFSDDEDLRRVHGLRANCDGILVGVGTILADDPHLTIKRELADGEAGEQPVRIVLDAFGRTPPHARVLDAAAPTLLLTSKEAQPIPGAHQVHVPERDGRLELDAALQALTSMGIQSVLVEGGKAVLQSFLEAGAWDTFTVFQSNELLGATGPRLWENGGPETLGLQVSAKETCGEGTLWTFSPR